MPAAFYYYPEGNTALEKIALNARITRLDPTTKAVVEDAYGGDGRFIRSFLGVRRRVRIAIDRVSLLTTNGKADYRALQGLLSHLRRGGACGFTSDTTKAVAIFPSGAWNVNQSVLYTAGNAFVSWESAAAFAIGDDVVIESAPIFGVEEYSYFTSVASITGLQMGNKLSYDYMPMYAMARWHRFYPALRLPADALDAPLLTNEHGIGWNLDIELEVDPAVHQIPAIVQDTGDTTGSLGLPSALSNAARTNTTLEAILDIARASGTRGTGNYNPNNSFTDFAQGLQVRRF